MSDILLDAEDQIKRVNARLAELVAAYTRSQLQRNLRLKAGDIRTAQELSRRLRTLSTELAYLAAQKRLCDGARQQVSLTH